MGKIKNYHWYTRLGNIGLYTFRVTPMWFSRGRCKELCFRVPLLRWTLDFSTKGQDYLTLVGGSPQLRHLDWIIDEFNASFNNLAVASLRYHLDWSVCDNSERRDVYENLICRLSEPCPDPTAEEDAAIEAWNPILVRDVETGRSHLTECPPITNNAYKSWQAREDEWERQIDQARHDFVDIMRGLWS